jgi:hypothetical protein
MVLGTEQPPVQGLASMNNKNTQGEQEDFQKKIENKKFYEAFADVVKDIIQLRVFTIIEDDINLLQDDLDKVEGQPNKRIVTIIDLLDGDIKNIIGSQFVEKPEYKELQTYHLSEVEKGQVIIKENLDSLQKAIKALIEISERQLKHDKEVK